MATPDTDVQLASLRTRIGEPVDPLQCRYTPTQLLDLLVASRKEVAEDTHCYQIKDSIAFTVAGSATAPVSQALPAAGSPFIISTVNDFIYLDSLTWEGVELDPVRAQDWANRVGSDETRNDEPSVFMFFGRQLQISGVPTEAGTLMYRGWAYPPDLTAAGVDAAFTARAADVAVWHAAMVALGADSRDYSFAEKMTGKGVIELKKQYRPRGPRSVRQVGC